MLHWKFKKKKINKSDRLKRIAVLDAIFSEFIRIRDANKDGICKCITSGQYFHWTECDAGHFITRDNMATRWEEENVNAQGRGDNRFKSGKQYEHGQAIDRKYGPGTADKLLAKSKGVCNWKDFEIEAMITYYRAEVKRMKIEKGWTKD